MIRTEFSKPAPGLEEFVRFYVHREFRTLSGVIVHPVPARPTPMIVFDFADPVEILVRANGARLKSPLAVVVGPQSCRRLEMCLRGTLNSFAIMFQPDGLRQLFSLLMHELADASGDVHSVLGSCMSQLWQTLGNLSSFQERMRVVNDFLLRQAVRSTAANTISRAVTYLVGTRGCSEIETLAHEAGLSPRHFSRRFIDHVGMRPKLFARVVRFQAALESKALQPGRTWTEVAHDFGYFDQMHMIHDFEQLGGGSPKEMLSHLETVFVEPISQIRSNAVAGARASDARLTL